MSNGWHSLAAFTAPSEPGGEREVVRRLSVLLEPLGPTRDELDRLGTAVAETVMNAMEHGNNNDPQLLVDVAVNTDGSTVEVLVSDDGGLRALPDHPEIPDLQAKLEGLQRPRGWGLFLIRSMVDDMDVMADPANPTRHTVRLRLQLGQPTVTPGREEPRHAQQL